MPKIPMVLPLAAFNGGPRVLLKCIFVALGDQRFVAYKRHIKKRYKFDTNFSHKPLTVYLDQPPATNFFLNNSIQFK